MGIFSIGWAALGWGCEYRLDFPVMASVSVLSYPVLSLVSNLCGQSKMMCSSLASGQPHIAHSCDVALLVMCCLCGVWVIPLMNLACILLSWGVIPLVFIFGSSEVTFMVSFDNRPWDGFSLHFFSHNSLHTF